MGCASSMLDAEKSVTSRCRDREHFIKLCVQHQHAFAAAHAAYIRSLKNTGAAIRQLGEGEEAKADIHGHGMEIVVDMAEDPKHVHGHVHGHVYGRRSLPYFPPPVPHFLLTPSFLSRASSMPLHNSISPKTLNLAKALASPSFRNPSFTHSLEENTEANAESQKHYSAKPPPPLPAHFLTPPPAPKLPISSHWNLYDVFRLTDDGSSALETEDLKCEVGNDDADVEKARTSQELQVTVEPLSTTKENNEGFSLQKAQACSSDMSFASVLRELDECFLVAFESGRDVARLLEGRRTHYHSNFADPNGSVNHSLRVLRVMSWGRHTHIPSANGEAVDIFFSGEKETHASTLDKLMAWEKKVHDEVKAGEVIRIQLEKRSVQLKKQKKHEEGSTTLSKTKAVVKNLQTRYLVEVQAVDAASCEVEKLRDDCLHSQLVDLVQKSMTMWRSMLDCHQQQYQLIEGMAILDSACGPTATSEFHLKNTLQLESEINIWHRNLDKLITAQKQYMNSVYHWLRLHIIEIESDGKGVTSSPQKMSTPPVYALCKAWLAALDQLPGNVPLHALKAFSNIIYELKLQQAEELKQKKKLDHLKKELEKKEQVLKAQEVKYNRSHTVRPTSDEREELVQASVMDRNPSKDREASVKLLRGKVETENEKYEKMCVKSGSMTLSTLQKGLPPVLNAMREFARTCSQRYTELFIRTVTEDTPILQIGY